MFQLGVTVKSGLTGMGILSTDIKHTDHAGKLIIERVSSSFVTLSCVS